MGKPIEIYHKRLHKVKYYAQRAHLNFLPFAWVKRDLSIIQREFNALPDDVKHHLQQRIDQCNRIDSLFSLADYQLNQGSSISKINWVGKIHEKRDSAYFYDLLSYLRYFPEGTPFLYLFGDITHVPNAPTLLKSRPISGSNENSVLLRLDSVRHFYVYPDKTAFADKKDCLVWRGAAHQPQRRFFLEKFCQHELCDVGCIHKNSKNLPYHRSFLSVKQQLAYRYVLSIEGNDVATNLKWISASNSLCFMTKPKYETWFLESNLIPDVHYVQLEDDYEDFDEKLSFYRKHPDAAQKIIQNAQNYIHPFLNPRGELIANVLVLDKYFRYVK